MHTAPEPVVVVPGFTPPFQREPIRLHPVARDRLRRGYRTMRKRNIPHILVSGAAVYPSGTEFIEAEEMAAYLRALGASDDEVLVEPKARHTTTNLRNAGRMMRERGWTRGLVVTTPFQWAYLAFPRISGFHARCRRELGYRVGRLERGEPGEVFFEPSDDVERSGPDTLDP